MLLTDLRDLIARHAPDRAVTITDGVRIAGAQEMGPPTMSTTGTVFVLMAQGAKRMAVGDHVYDYRGGQCLVASVDLPISGHFTEASPERPALGFALTLRPSAVADLLLHPSSLEHSRSGQGAAARSGISVHDAPDDLIEAVIRMVRLLDRPRDRAVLAPLVEREILWLLMRGPDGALVRQLGLADSKLNRMGLAARWIRDRHAESIRVDELARITRMSPSAFHRSFQAVTAMSPIQFQKQIRLQEARIRLVADPGDVAGAAYAVGYESASQFSRDYRRRFGASPSQDAARLRDQALAEAAER
jgi:AraC-like DNA-binding protein